MKPHSFLNSDLYGISVTNRTRDKAIKTVKRFKKKYAFTGEDTFHLRARSNPFLHPYFGLQDIHSEADGDPIQFEKAVIIGTIRMGYGHYRIAMAMASAACSKGYIPYWFDLLNFPSAGARMIRDLDKWYSLGSRLSQKSKLFNKLLWDPLMGKWYKPLIKNLPIMEVTTLFSEVYRDIPVNTPFIGTHPWNAQAALHAGLNKVVNAVPDNWPMGFHIAPGALHTVQSPSAYFRFRTFSGLGGDVSLDSGMSEKEVFFVGHYVDHEMVSMIDPDCLARLERMRNGTPRRLLFSIGGAGAQQELLASLMDHLLPKIRNEKVAVYLNCGDHHNAVDTFRSCVSDFSDLASMHCNWEETRHKIENADDELSTGLHVFLHENPFSAVYTTNLLMRVSDVLITKPSELAFYPIPKLLLQRVGGHEAWGAVRSSELGDSTIECTSQATALKALTLLLERNDLLEQYCRQIMKMGISGVYDGAYHAVTLAVDGSLQY